MKATASSSSVETVSLRGELSRSDLSLASSMDQGPGWMISYLDVFILTSALFASLLVESQQTNAELEAELAQRVPAEVAVAVAGERAELQIGGAVLFEESEARLSEHGQALLKELLPLIKQHAGEILIEGHTDSIPIKTAAFPSNWELAAARATEVVRFLTQEGIERQRLRAISYADTRPLVPERNAEDRARNRRVGIVLLSTG